MCGRFTREYAWAQIYALYMLTSTPSNVQPNFNVCPTTKIGVDCGEFCYVVSRSEDIDLK
jgi:putative SOS response-associated peptidase YedK